MGKKKQQKEKTVVIPKKVGRPLQYKSELCEKVIELGKKGYGKAEIALELEISRETIHAWCEKYKEFSYAMAKSQDYSEGWWCKSARNNIENRSYNAALYSINMQNRFGWNKKTEVSGSITISHEDAIKELE